MKPSPAYREDESRLALASVAPARLTPGLREDVIQGLLQGPPRMLPPKYFYDARGSVLFDRICDTPEYYPTRTEDALLAVCARDIIAQVRPRHILELGAGTARKTRRLFDACGAEGCHSAYAPLDVCREILLESGQSLIADYDWLTVNALVGDYHAGLDNLPQRDGPTLIVFLGSTIGNFSHSEAVRLLGEIRASMESGDRLLLGADRVKDPGVLHRAYNDAAGLTAAFNRNLLRVLNRELDADFETTGFHHHASYNPQRQQVEMYLIARRCQRVRFRALDRVLDLAEGDGIQTELSRKFTRQSLGALLAAAGFHIEEHFAPDNDWFSLVLAAPAGTH